MSAEKQLDRLPADRQEDLPRYRAQVVEVSEPSHPMAQELLAFWESRRKGGGLLSRSEIPSREITKLMSNLYLLEPVDKEGGDWLFRLVGEALNNRFGFSPKGRRVSEVHDPDAVERSIQSLRKIANTCTPRILRGRFLGIDRDFYDLEIVHLPILGPDGHTVWILGGVFFFN